MDKLINFLAAAFVWLLFIGIALMPLLNDFINLGDTKDEEN